MAYGIDPYGRPVGEQAGLAGNLRQPRTATAKPAVPTSPTGQEVAQAPSQQAYPQQNAVTDPVQQQLAQYRQLSGGRADNTDANLLQHPEFQHWQRTGQFIGQPQAQQAPARRPLESYTAARLPGFQAPSDPRIEGLQRGLIERMLVSPETLSPEAVAAMREQGKERALAYEAQAREALGRDTLNRGIFGGGFHQAGNRRLAGDRIQALVDNDRAIALEKAARDRADQLSATEAARGFLGDTYGRAASTYGINRDTALSNEQLIQQALNSRNADVLFEDEQNRFNKQLGLSYTQLEAAQQQALIAALLGGM